MLEDDRIVLRAPEPEDLEKLYEWENNPGIVTGKQIGRAHV